MLPDNIDPRKLEDQILQRELEAMVQRGGLRFSPWAKEGRPVGRPPEGWTLQSFSDVVAKHTPSTPEFLGAQAPMGWLKQATETINGAEGYRSRAYHGALSSQRKPGKIDVTPGDAVGPEEVAVGYGFNMTQADGRKFYEAALKGKDAPAFDDVLNGRSTITQVQAAALREHMILQKNAILDRMLDGTPVRDHQRAALVSMLYQGANVAEVVKAIKEGKADEEVAGIIRRTTLGPKRKSGRHAFAIRRDHEASLFLGAKAEGYFAKINSNALPVE